MKAVKISASGIIRENRQTVFAMLYDLEKFITWYNDPPNLEVESLAPGKFQASGYRQRMHLANRKMSFDAEVGEAVADQYIKGTISGFISGTFHWSVQDCSQGTRLQKDIIIDSGGLLKYLFTTTVVRIGDVKHCQKAFSRLNDILCKKSEVAA